MGIQYYVIGAGFILYVLWTAARPRYHIKFVVSQGRVDFVKGIADARRGRLEEFFLKDLKSDEKLTIYGKREKNGRLVIFVKGTKNQNLKQRIRNYLLTAL